MSANASASRGRRRVERGIYEQPNGKYMVCFMVDGKPRFRVVDRDLEEARRQREVLVRTAQRGEVAVATSLRLRHVVRRWLVRYEALVPAGQRRGAHAGGSSLLPRRAPASTSWPPASVGDHRRRRLRPGRQHARCRLLGEDDRQRPGDAARCAAVRSAPWLDRRWPDRQARVRRAPTTPAPPAAGAGPRRGRPAAGLHRRAVPAAGCDGAVHRDADLRAVRAGLGRRRPRRRDDPRPRSTLPRAPWRARDARVAEDACATSRWCPNSPRSCA
jgi:hypothetical protein